MAKLQHRGYDKQGHYQRWQLEANEVVIVDFADTSLESSRDEWAWNQKGVTWAIHNNAGSTHSMHPHFKMHKDGGEHEHPAESFPIGAGEEAVIVEDEGLRYAQMVFRMGAGDAGGFELRTPYAVKVIVE